MNELARKVMANIAEKKAADAGGRRASGKRSAGLGGTLDALLPGKKTGAASGGSADPVEKYAPLQTGMHAPSGAPGREERAGVSAYAGAAAGALFSAPVREGERDGSLMANRVEAVHAALRGEYARAGGAAASCDRGYGSGFTGAVCQDKPGKAGVLSLDDLAAGKK